MNMPTEKITHTEHDHIVEGPGGNVVKDIDIEETIEKVSGPAGTSLSIPPSGGTPPAIAPVAESVSAPTMATRINPRTGKPLSIPKPLSLTPQDMSPIVPETMADVGGQMIREIHEEVSHVSWILS
jgi:hypothetical protein